MEDTKRITVGMVNKLFKRNSIADSAESGLWLGVLCQAVSDAQTSAYRVSSKTFFDLRNPWFVQICGYAGLNPEFVLDHVYLVNSKYHRKQKGQIEGHFSPE